MSLLKFIPTNIIFTVIMLGIIGFILQETVVESFNQINNTLSALSVN